MQGVRRKELSFVIVVFEEERMRYNIFQGEINNYDYYRSERFWNNRA